MIELGLVLGFISVFYGIEKMMQISYNIDKNNYIRKNVLTEENLKEWSEIHYKYNPDKELTPEELEYYTSSWGTPFWYLYELTRDLRRIRGSSVEEEPMFKEMKKDMEILKHGSSINRFSSFHEIEKEMEIFKLK